jgi:hypothetical protein
MPNFKKARGFNLRSGNKPNMSSFKMMGSTTPSPITSPYKQEEVAKTEEELKAETEATQGDAEGIAESLNEPKVNKFKTAASKVGNTLVGAFTGGLDAVYGSGKVIPGNTVKFSNPKKKKPEKKFGTTALDGDTTEDE